jgi:hypothetical protein
MVGLRPQACPYALQQRVITRRHQWRSTCNQAPCCRRHHRAKTTGGWSYITVEPGVYLWRSPLGSQFLKDHTGTLDVTPDAERRKLAREFRAHFGEP